MASAPEGRSDPSGYRRDRRAEAARRSRAHATVRPHLVGEPPVRGESSQATTSSGRRLVPPMKDDNGSESGQERHYGNWTRLEPRLRSSIVEGIVVFLSLFDDNPVVARAFYPTKSAYTGRAKRGLKHGTPLPAIEDLLESGKVLALNFPVGLNPALARAYAPSDFPAPTVYAPKPTAHTTRYPNGLDVVERVRRYLMRVVPAVTGQHGDLHTFRVYCRVVRGFDLSDHDALCALREWNARCQPPWSNRELLAKIADARRYGREPIATHR
ncbi:MAG: hypothetical protein ABI988_09575 [Nitrospirota bacterium]